MQSKKIFVAAMIAFFAFGQVCSAEDTRILAIRQLYESIQRAILEGRLIETDVTFIANKTISQDFAGELESGRPVCRFYWDLHSGNLSKVEIHSAGVSITRSSEYIFSSDGKLAFCYTRTTGTFDKTIFSEERYYFSGGVLLRYMLDKKTVDRDFSSETLRAGQEIQNDAVELKQMFDSIIRVLKLT